MTRPACLRDLESKAFMPVQLQLKVRLDAFDVRNFGPDRHGIETPDSVSDRGLRGQPTASGHSPYGLLVIVCRLQHVANRLPCTSRCHSRLQQEGQRRQDIWCSRSESQAHRLRKPAFIRMLSVVHSSSHNRSHCSFVIDPVLRCRSFALGHVDLDLESSLIASLNCHQSADSARAWRR